MEPRWQDGGMTAPDLRFVLALHAQLAGADRDRSFVWSPYSVASALGLAAAGAKGTTQDEIVAALAVDGDLDGLARALAAGARLTPGTEGVPGASLAVANTLWADATMPVAPRYLETVRAWPGGGARTVDFDGDPDGARGEVNADVERTTNGLIRDLLTPGVVTRETRAILVNALWLRASWLTAFGEQETRPAPFHAPGGDVDVPTMHVQRRMRYARRHGWRIVSVPAGSGVVADVLLPDGDLAGAEPALDPATLDDLVAAASPAEVSLWLPRFRVEAAAGLNDPLAAIGVRTLFTDASDLSGVTDGEEPLKVSAAVHKAVLDVDESGLEGAAATAIVMALTSFVADPARPVEVRVDRPFLVLVRHEASGSLYFVARVTRP
jgi:serine protease inhibitor